MTLWKNVTVLAVLIAIVVTGNYLSDEASAADSSNIYTDEEGGAEYTISGGIKPSARVTGWDGIHPDVIIKDSIIVNGRTYSVKSISADAFREKDITSLVLPNSDNSIDIYNNAFSGCTKLTTVSLGTSVVELWDNIFKDCTALKTFTSTNLSSIGLNTFAGCSSLCEINLNNGLKTIGESAFRNCTALIKINLPDSVINIGSFAFSGCTSLTEVDLSGKLQSVSTSLFENCSSLKSIHIPGSVNSFGSRSFKDCTSLASITFGDGVDNIYGYELFLNCSFETVLLPASVSKLNLESHTGRQTMWPTTLSTISVAESNPFFSSEDGILFTKDKSLLLLCPSGKTGSVTANVNVDAYAFYNSSLEHLVLSDGVTSIGDYAFANSALIDVIWTKTPDTVGTNVFYNCTKLNSITLPADLSRIYDGLFYNCTSLVLTELPESVQYIGANAFRGCVHVNPTSLPENLGNVGSFAFNNAGIESVSLGISNEVVIGGSAFSTDSLKHVVLGKVSFGDVDKNDYKYLFYGTNLESITVTGDFSVWSQIGPLSIGKDGELFACIPTYEGKVTIPSSVISILDAFIGCSKITEIDCEDSTKTISVGTNKYRGSFEGCTSLVSIVLPNVVLLDNYTFRGCSSLETVTITTIDRIGDMMFSGTSLENLLLDYSKTEYVGIRAFENMKIESFDASGMEIAEYAFKGCSNLQTFVTDENTILNTGALSGSGIQSLTLYLDCPVKIQISNGTSNMSGIASWLCSECTELSQVILVKGSSQRLVVGEATFEGCTSLKTIQIPDGLEFVYLDCKSFADSGLTSFVVESNRIFANRGSFQNSVDLTTVSLIAGSKIVLTGHLFANCTSLKTLNYSRDVGFEFIDLSAFVGCINFKVLEMNCRYIIDADLDAEINNPGTFNPESYYIETVDLYGYSGSYDNLATLLNYPSIKRIVCTGENSSYLVEDSVVYGIENGVPVCAVLCERSAKTVMIKEGISTIGRHAFEGCNNLSKVAFPQSITSIDYGGISGPVFLSIDGSPLELIPEVVSGRQFSSKEGVSGLVMNPVLSFLVGGEPLTELMYVWGQEFIVPEVPEKIGYDGSWEEFGVPAKDLSINAVYSPHVHKITYTIDGVVHGEIESGKYGETVTLRQTPEKVGYTFTQWSSKDISLANGTFVMGDEDVIIESTSSPNKHTVTYMVNGTQFGDTETYDFGTEVIVKADYQKDGYESTPWSAEGIKVTDGKFVLGDADVVFSATSVMIVSAGTDGAAEIVLPVGETTFKPSEGTKTVTVKMAENTSVEIADAADLVGKVVVSEVKEITSTSGISGKAYEFTFTADGTQYNGKMEVTLPYTKENGKVPVVYFWDGSKSTEMKVLSSTDTSVTFETDHNSEYIVASEMLSNNGNSNEQLIPIIAVLIVVLIAIGGVFIIRRRRNA